MVWYMIDAGPASGGTWCVPGAHRDTRNPRGPRDGITVSAPIPGELQVEAPAGSVFIQDSRMCAPTIRHPTVHRSPAAGADKALRAWQVALDGVPQHERADARRSPKPLGVSLRKSSGRANAPTDRPI